MKLTTIQPSPNIAILLAILVLFLPSLTTALGINCRGSAMCTGCKHPLVDLLSLTTTLPDTSSFKNGAQVACASCHMTKREGTCVFIKNLVGEGRSVSGKQVKEAMERLRGHGCGYCGSAPVREGGDGEDGDGEVVVNFVTEGCVRHGSRLCWGKFEGMV
ncbi:killer toxin [Periconia macrospinosa]|uniref:Killer toxin n=1 Tax=Periconia macrospinosa TaxID=97972 RepID=A0A2V1E6G2_9PLEO|nr:killer toxin [Periconia macrospinosa]